MEDLTHAVSSHLMDTRPRGVLPFYDYVFSFSSSELLFFYFQWSQKRISLIQPHCKSMTLILVERVAEAPSFACKLFLLALIVISGGLWEGFFRAFWFLVSQRDRLLQTSASFYGGLYVAS